MKFFFGIRNGLICSRSGEFNGFRFELLGLAEKFLKCRDPVETVVDHAGDRCDHP